ncbi:MAG: hypothetical protein ABR597_08855 [Bacteroidales bacterium]
MKKFLSIFTLFFCIAVIARANDKNEKLVISQWLKTQSHDISFPVFHDTENTNGKSFELKELLEFDHISLKDHFPQDGKVLSETNDNALCIP